MKVTKFLPIGYSSWNQPPISRRSGARGISARWWLEASLEGRHRMFAALVLDFLQEDGPRQEELKRLKDPKVFLKMILDEGTHRVLLDSNISLVKLDDEWSSLKWGEWWWSDDQEKNDFFSL